MHWRFSACHHAFFARSLSLLGCGISPKCNSTLLYGSRQFSFEFDRFRPRCCQMTTAVTFAFGSSFFISAWIAGSCKLTFFPVASTRWRACWALFPHCLRRMYVQRLHHWLPCRSMLAVSIPYQTRLSWVQLTIGFSPKFLKFTTNSDSVVTLQQWKSIAFPT